MKQRSGFCPNCDSEGTVGETCPEKGCHKRRYGFIPTEFHDRLKTVTAGSADVLIGLTIDDYLIVDTVGSGGFGKVYLALQLPILMRTALKLMDRGHDDPVLAENLARKFQGEAEALATLSHPNVVRLMKYGLHGHMPYLVMEYIEGRTLKAEINDLVVRRQELDPAVVPHIMNQVLGALEAAHGKGIVHRDIKPDNIMLEEVPGDRHFVKVLDFGLAKFVEERTDTSLLMGTPIYMAPEQIQKTNIGPWTDLYALGIILFQFITGRRPFVGRSNREVLERKLDTDYDPASRVLDLELPGEVNDFFRQSLAMDPAARYQSATDFREAMNAVFEGMEKTLGQSVAATDLTDLLDPSEVARVRAEMERLEKEKADLQEERRRLEEERQRLEERQKSTTQPSEPPDKGVGVAVSTRRAIPAEEVRSYTPPASEEAPPEASPADPGTDSGTTPPPEPEPPDITARSLADEPPRAGIPWTLVGVLVLAAALGFFLFYLSSDDADQKVQNMVDRVSSTLSPAATDTGKEEEAPPEAPATPRGMATDSTPPGVPSGMKEVPPGGFRMGCNRKKDRQCEPSEKSAHPVDLTGFWVDTTEVTVKMYRPCVRSGQCTEPLKGPYCNWERKGRDGHPINCVNWIQAKQFCEWAGKKLPTEAQWEKAARGTDGRIYPWGDESPGKSDAILANLTGGKDGYRDTAPVGSFGKGAGFYGALDQGGNVREWVLDWWTPRYRAERVMDPDGPEKGTHKVARGGGWSSGASDLRTSRRYKMDPTQRYDTVGFRCVKPY